MVVADVFLVSLGGVRKFIVTSRSTDIDGDAPDVEMSLRRRGPKEEEDQ